MAVSASIHPASERGQAETQPTQPLGSTRRRGGSSPKADGPVRRRSTRKADQHQVADANGQSPARIAPSWPPTSTRATFTFGSATHYPAQARGKDLDRGRPEVWTGSLRRRLNASAGHSPPLVPTDDLAQDPGNLVGRVGLVQQLEAVGALLRQDVAVARGQDHRQAGQSPLQHLGPVRSRPCPA